MKPTIYIHHDAYDLEGKHLPSVDYQHKSQGYPISTLGYHTFYQYFIELNGDEIQCRPEMDPLTVYKEAHENSIPICIAGNFNKTTPTDAQWRTLSERYTKLKVKYGTNALDIKEHRNYQATSCPGSRISRGQFALFFIQTQLRGVEKLLQTISVSVLSLVR